MKVTKNVQIGSNPITFQTGRIAKQADGSCLTRLGDTVVLATACRAKSAMPRSFLPLTVDYREYTYAGGRIPGGFFKREGRPSEKEIITCRLIDRPLRPLFPEGYFDETQIVCSVLSADGEHDPDILAINGASFALMLSKIPFQHAIGAVRVGLIDGEIVFNPENSQRDVSDLDLIVVATEDAIAMVEAAANQLPEDLVLECIFRAHEQIKQIIAVQREMVAEAGGQKDQWEAKPRFSQETYDEVKRDLGEALSAALHTKGKFERKDAVAAVVGPYLERVPEDDEDKRGEIKKVVSTLEEEILRESILHTSQRFDGRALDEIREITIDTGLLPRTHGSALFTRGETQSLVSATLGTRRDAQIIEEYEGETLQKFMLHYNFPPFSVGEVKFLRGPSRREIGHGVLARRALMPVLPHEDDFPYTVRVVSDIMESNGSSSMATVCGGSLALFDAGVPLIAPVAGVAMGLVKAGDTFAVLSDIAGQEDHYGDMDFKVAGTSDGITALQMDIKITGVTREVMKQALEQAKAGRLHILGLMAQAAPAPREELSQYAPRLHTMQIDKNKIRDIIGPGGKTIRSIIEETGCEIEVENDGTVIIASPDGIAAGQAREMIERLTESPEIGKDYSGIVRRVEAYGAFVEILPGTDGLLHISEMAPNRVNEVSDIVSEGDEITVKVVNIDDQNRVRLSRKAVIMEAPDFDPSQYPGMEESSSSDRPRGRGGRGDRHRGRRSDSRSGPGGDRNRRSRA
ncbi:MAG: polyribonucleotide nucleotidyltransferase [Thermoanaerobaculia bacterium]